MPNARLPHPTLPYATLSHTVLLRSGNPLRRMWRSALLAAVVLSLSSCGLAQPAAPALQIQQGSPPPAATAPQDASQKSRLINKDGMTVETRFTPPEGFSRSPVAQGSFAEYLRQLPLKPDGAVVRLYDGRVKMNNTCHEAVLDVDTGNRDLQQCADAVMRLRAEYLYGRGRYEEICFYFANGFKAEYARWMNGGRVAVEGNKASWVQRASPSNTYQSFRAYLDIVFAYANTSSLAGQMKRVEPGEMQVGDVFVDRGHCVIVVDMAESKTGRKVFVIAQSYMPAQDIHILKNPSDAGLSPWYDLDFGETLRTPEWTFTRNDLRRF